METIKMSKFDVAYEQNGVQICTLKTMREDEKKIYFLLTTSTGLGTKTIGVMLTDPLYNYIISNNFSNESIKAAIAYGSAGMFNVENDLYLENQNSRHV